MPVHLLFIGRKYAEQISKFSMFVENCNHRRNQKQKAFPTDELVFLGNFVFTLKLHAVYLYHFSFNSSIQSQHKGKTAIKACVTVRICAM